uniref:transcription factor TFIIIB component B'' homolog n=1 Tax=Semicossyphus pulcher TaxID=241346 RepID=UPI0037E7F656
MFRRSRFSIRPNVGTAGRAAATSQEAPSASQEAGEAPKDAAESSTATAVTDNKSVVTPSEKPGPQGDGNDQTVEGSSSSAAVQRRKRFSIKPKVAPGRVSTLSRTPKSPAKAASETSVAAPVSTTSSTTGTTASPRGLQSPRRRRLSEDSKQPNVQPKPTIISSDISEPSAVPPAVDLQEKTHLPAGSGKELESTSDNPVKEVPSRLPDKVPLSLPDKEAIELSEKAKTLVSSKNGLALSPPAFSLSRLLNDPSDLQRIAKARKLRELLKQEMHKEKKSKKAKARVKEFTLDPAKMTMRDLIRYLPESNPMTSTLEESVQENETVVPPSPAREASPERAPEPEVPTKIASPRAEEEEQQEQEDEEANEEQDDQDDSLMVPQVKVAEDGTLIIDEESLTVEVQRAKGPNLVKDRDPIFERGSTTTYSSFRKGTYSKPWSSEEADMFFLAISMVGTDFSMICQLFPHRARSEIKNKFKKEERENAWRIDKAFRERRKLDIEYFSKLLEKILEVQKNRKKLKSLANKNSPKKQKRKTKSQKASKKLSDVDEDDEEEEDEMPDLEGEGEKENEDLCNEGGEPVSKPKKKRKRKSDASTEEPNEKKNKKGEKSNEQDEAYTPEDAEAALPEDCTNLSENTEDVNSAKDTTIKPAKLSRGRAPKPLLPLGKKWAKKPPKAGDAEPDKGEESANDGASKEQVNKDASPLKPANKKSSADDTISSEEEDACVQPQRPTRYGRVPKPTMLLNYPAKEDPHTSASETTPASPSTASAARPKPKPTAKRGRSSKPQSTQESKKPKLVTLRASQPDYSDEENEKQWDEKEVEEELHAACGSSDSIAQAFVPASLRSPQPMISEVEETMEELDILASMPVLDISQDVLCPETSFERAHETEPCEHQLDLLVDVIDFLSAEHTEVSEDQSYNEAAQTLLTIGNLAHLSQSAQNQEAIQDDITGTTSASVDEASQYLEEEIASKPAAQEESNATPFLSATSGQAFTETSETVTTVEQQNTTTDNDDTPSIITSNQGTDSDMDPIPKLDTGTGSSNKDSTPTRKGRLSKVKPKPNLGQASRTAKSKFKPETSAARTEEESGIVVPNLSEATETHSIAEETPTIVVSSHDILSGSQERYVAASDQSASENQINLTPDTQSESISEQVSRDSRSAAVIPDSHVGTSKSSTNNLVPSDTVVTELQIEHGTNINTAPVQESSKHQALSVTPVEDLHDSQKQEIEDASTPLTRKSRFQKVKPKPNLAQTSRTVRSKSQSAKETEEKDSKPTSTQTINEKTTVEVEEEPAFTPSLTNQSTGPAPDSEPSLCLGSTLTPTEELPKTEENKTNAGVVGGQEESVAATSVQSEQEKQNFSEAQVEPSREHATRDSRSTPESTDEKQPACVGTAESSCGNLTDSVVIEYQGKPGSNMDSAPVQESTDHPAPCVMDVDVLPDSQKQESEDTSTPLTRKSRFQKVKPKPNLTQTSRSVRSKPQATKDTAEKDSKPTPMPKGNEKTQAEVSAETTCITSPEKPSQSTGPAADSIPPLDLGSTLTTIEELPTSEENKTSDGVVGGQEEPVAAISVQSEPEKQNFSEAQLEPSREQAIKDTKPKSQPTDEKLGSCVGTTQSTCHNLRTNDSEVTESHVEQALSMDAVCVQESSDHPAPCVTHKDELPVNQKQDSEDASTSQTRRSRFQKVKPKPNLAQTSRTVRSKPQATKDTVEKDSKPTPNPKGNENTEAEISTEPTCTNSTEKPSQSTGLASDQIPPSDLGSTLTPQEELPIKKNTDLGGLVGGTTPPEKPSLNTSTGIATVSQPSLELNSNQKPTEELSLTEEKMADVGVDSSSEGSQQNLPQRRQRFAKVKPKPNIGSSTRTRQATQLQSNEISKPLSPTKLGSLESEKSSDSKVGSCDGSVIATSWVAENRSVLTDSVLESKSTEKATVEEESIRDKTSNNDKVEAGPAPHRDCKQDKSIIATKTITQPTDDPTAIKDVQSSKDGLNESEVTSLHPANTEVAQDSKVASQLPQSMKHSESQDAVQQCSENNQTAAKSTHDEPPDSSMSLRQAPQSRRGRLVKPRPNLGRSRQPPQPQQAEHTKQAETDSNDRSGSVDASVSHKPTSELRPDIQEPVEAVLEQHSSPPIVAGSSLSCVTQVPDNSTQDASTSSTGGTQSNPSLTLFPDMLSGQVPSDPDEPFFILSLTEIPVCSSGQALDSASEPLPYLPVTDASVQQQSSVPEEHSAAAGDLSNVTAPVSTEESAETGLISVKHTGPDPAAQTSSIRDNPVEPQEIPAVQPSTIPETVESSEETEKQRATGTGRRAKRQVEPKTSRKKQASKTVAAKEEESIPIETNTTQESELPGLSVQLREVGEVVTEQQKKGGRHKNIAKDPEDSSSGAQPTQTRGTRNRKPKGLLSETSNTAPSKDDPPVKAASKGQKVKAPRAVRKQSTPEPVASTSYVAPPTPSPTQTSGEKHSTPSTTFRTPLSPERTSDSPLCSEQPLSSSQSSVEMFSSQQSLDLDGSSIEEATSVSQYFLSDIFTDVEEG